MASIWLVAKTEELYNSNILVRAKDKLLLNFKLIIAQAKFLFIFSSLCVSDMLVKALKVISFSLSVEPFKLCLLKVKTTIFECPVVITVTYSSESNIFRWKNAQS